MNRIYKYAIEMHAGHDQVIEMPCGSEIHALRMLGNGPYIWASAQSLCVEQKITEARTFRLYFDDQDIWGWRYKDGDEDGDAIEVQHYVETFQSGQHAWHLFEIVEEPRNKIGKWERFLQRLWT